MKVLFLSDVWPNNILGRWAAYEKSQGNEIFRKCNNPDKIVCSWSFRRSIGQTLLNFNNVEIIEGGPFVNQIRAPEYIENLMPDYEFLGVDYAIGRLTVGCPNRCPWCVVWRMWGNDVRQFDSLDNFVPEGFDKVKLLDDNFLAYNRIVGILEELAERELKVCFPSGVDAREATDKKAEALSRVNYRGGKFLYKYLYTAFDDSKNEDRIEKGIDILRANRVRVRDSYALGGYPNGDEFEDLYYRCLKLIRWRINPYVMPFETANREIRQFKRFIALRYYKKFVREHGAEKGLKIAWEKYSRR